ncbi:hypothetical protein FSP39_003604 [Pinctada imbricata]|uniref:N-acetylneuraminate lyase n=1 Tax=Pinctada imbricata TaxID=66713 RepID=A0AA89BQ96_PINIB|nr:hypothetical protein FSP39_003604 [Pinctada imbricata]
MTKEERQAIVEEWIKVAKGRLKVVVQVGSLHLKESKELSFLLKDSLIAYCKGVASEAPTLPFYYYHLPMFTGVTLNMEDFMRKAKTQIPSLRGIKFSNQDLVDMIGVKYAGDFNILYGTDSQLLAGMTTGAHGAIGSNYNYMPKVFIRMFKDIEVNDLESARKEQLKCQQLRRIIVKYGNLLGGTVASMKPLMSLVGVDVGPPREPMREMTEEETKMFLNEVKELGVINSDSANFA